jgi:putative transcriptional regulator
MPLSYKIDVMKALKDKGFSTYRMRTDKIIGERQLQQIRQGEIVSPACLEKLCDLLDCQPGDLIQYEKEG